MKGKYNTSFRLKAYSSWHTQLFSCLALCLAIYSGGSAVAHEGETQSIDATHTEADAAAAARARDRNEPVFRTISAQARATLPGDLQAEGEWGPLKTWPYVFASAANLPDGRIVTWGGNQRTRFSGGMYTYTGIWDPQTDLITEYGYDKHSMFCAVPTMRENGEVFVVGGDGPTSNRTSIFDYKTDQWEHVDTAGIGRWYNGSLQLPNGQVFMALGQDFENGVSRYPELWTENKGWEWLTGIDLQSPILDHTDYGKPEWFPMLSVAPDGDILHVGPTPQMHNIDPTGDGSIEAAGAGITDWDSNNQMGTMIVFDEGKILTLGGISTKNRATIVDMNGAIPQVTAITNLNQPRGHVNAVMLPTGEVFVVGGTNQDVWFSDAGSILTPEIWNPDTQVWRQVADHIKPRNYHSVALLMPDGRIFSGGGGLCGCSADHPDHQVYSPGYLYNADGTSADRPAITFAPDATTYGGVFDVSTYQNIDRFTMIKMGGTTHSQNTDTRFLEVSFTGNNGAYQLTMEANSNLLTPGYWMLFALNDQGVPSESKTIQVKFPIGILNPGHQNSFLGQATQLVLDIDNPAANSLTFSATGLPAGLVIDNTGVISGIPTTVGVYDVDVSVMSASFSRSISFLWGVSSENPGFGSARYAKLVTFSSVDGSPYASAAEINLLLEDGTPIDRLGWTVTTDSEEELISDGRAVNAIDGNVNSIWHTEWVNSSPLHPHEIIIDMSLERRVGGFSYLPRQDASNASIKDYAFYVSLDGIDWGLPLAEGTFDNTQTEKVVTYILPNQPPILSNPGNQNNAVNTSINLSLVASDSDGDPLSYSATDLPTGLSINAISGVISGTATTVGVYDVGLTVSSGGDTTGASFLWSISPVNLTPGFYQYAKFVSYASVNNAPHASAAEIKLLLEDGSPIERQGWTVTTDSEELLVSDGRALNAIDGDVNTIWHTEWVNSNPIHPHEFVIDMGAKNRVSGFSYLPRQDVPNGTVTDYAFYVSVDGNFWGLPVVEGVFNNDQTEKVVTYVIPNPILSIDPINASPTLINQDTFFTAQASGSGNLQYRWLFGDGTAASSLSSSPDISHRFTRSGRYLVTVDVFDDMGNEARTQFVQNVHAPLTADRPTVSMSLIFVQAAGNDQLWSVNPDNNSVTVLQAETGNSLAEILVGGSPRALAQAPDGRVWVSNKQSATISIIDPDTLAVDQVINLPLASQPHGLLFSPDGQAAYVSLESSGQVLKLDPVQGTTLASVIVGRDVRHLSIVGDSSTLYATRFISPPLINEGTAAPQENTGAGEVFVINTGDMSFSQTIPLQYSTRGDDQSGGRGLPNYLGPVVVSPDGLSAWVPSKQDNVSRGQLRDGEPLDHDNTVRSISSYLDLATQQEVYENRIDFDNGGIASTGLYGPNGNYLFVALEGSREVSVVDAYSHSEIGRLAVGRAPQGLALSDDGLTLYVHNFMDRSISTFDLAALDNFGTPNLAVSNTYQTVTTELLSEQVLKGKQFFYDAQDSRLASESYMSCASCHNDGDDDGRVWDLTGFGEGLRNTISLKGHGGPEHGRLHWSSNFDEVQDFEGQIRTLAAGTGLLSEADFNATSHPLEATKAGRSVDLDALAAYVNSLTRFAQSPARKSDGSLTDDALAGRVVFETNDCASCHSGPAYTDSQTNSLHDIGTIKTSSGARLGGTLTGIDTPTLLGVWNTAPYLHDGSASTLADAIDAHNNVSITTSERDLLVSFVKQIDGGESEVSMNLALGKVTTQSSTGWGGVPARAVDGNTSGVYSVGSVTHTDLDNQAWWQVDLGQSYDLTKINIWNRTNCCSSRLSDYSIFISNQPFSSTDMQATRNSPDVTELVHAGIAANLTTKAINRSGQYIRIQLSSASQFLSLAEVEVLGNARVTSVNVSQGKIATQSTTGYGGAAAYAVDGNTNGVYSAGSVSHTFMNNQAWWQVDLGQNYDLTEIKIWNRTDCCSDRLSDYSVFISDQPFSSTDMQTTRNTSGVTELVHSGVAASLTTKAINRSGQYIRIQLNSGAQYLSLAEVEVFN